MIVAVTWWDAASRITEGRWSSLDDIKALSPSRAVSVGHLVADEPDYLTVAAHLVDELAGGEICIPRVCVISIIEMKETDHA